MGVALGEHALGRGCPQGVFSLVVGVLREGGESVGGETHFGARTGPRGSEVSEHLKRVVCGYAPFGHGPVQFFGVLR